MLHRRVYHPLALLLLLVLTTVAAANTVINTPLKMKDGSGAEECECPCWPYSIITDEGGTAPPQNAGDGYPVSLMCGNVIEATTDLRLPGPAATATIKRTYNSMAGAAVDTAYDPFWIFGNNITGGMITRYLVEVDGTTIDLYLDSLERVRYTLRSGSSTIYDAPDDHYSILVHNTTDDTYEQFNEQSGEIWIFRDFTRTEVGSRGLLWKRTSQYRPDEEIEFVYTDSGAEANRLSSMIVSQGWTVDFVYQDGGTNDGRVRRIDVLDENDKVLQRIRYTYKGDAGLSLHSDVSSTTEDGDLLLVENLRVGSDPADLKASPSDSDFSGYAVTMYRYAGSGRVAGVWEPDATERMITPIYGVAPKLINGWKGGIDFLDESDADVEDYVSRTFTYYSSDTATTAISTPWDSGANENLNTLYGVEERSETDVAGKVGEANRETLYRVKTMTTQTGASGVTHHYYYTQLNSTSPTGDADEARWVTIVDTEDSAGSERYRNLYVMNARGVLLRQVFIDTPTSSPNYWCTSYILGTEGYALNRPLEMRMPSAHTEVDTGAELIKFLNPTSGTNDADTLNNGSGRVFITEYDDADYDSANGTYTVTQGVKEGESGTINWIGYEHFQKFDGTSDDQYGRYLPVEAYVEPDFGTTDKPVPQSATAGGGEYKPEADDVMTIAYTFYDTTTQQKVSSRTTTLPSVESAENGSDVQTVTKEHFDALGRTRWIKDGEGNITYMSYDPDSGQIAYVMQDVETDDLPGDITSGSAGRWVAWDSDPDTAGNQNAIPSGFTNGDDDNLQLVTLTDYDDLARTRRVEDAEGVVTYLAYVGGTTRVYPGWDDAADEPLLPIMVTKTDDEGRTTEMFTLDPAGVTIGLSSGEPTGVDTGVTQDGYLAWSKVAYNDQSQVTHTDRYHNIPSSGDGTPGTNYYRDEVRYDDEGRVRYTITHVSGGATSSAVEQVSRLDYDRLGRVTAVHTTVSGTGHDVSSASLDTGLEQVAAIYYDQATPGSGSGGVGDSLVTARVAYNDASDADWYTETRYHRNWRAQLRGVTLAGKAGSGDSLTVEGPYLARLTDNLGRTIGSALFQDGNEPTWTEDRVDWEDLLDPGSAQTGRRTLTRHAYDLLGQRYHTDTYNTAASDGAVLGRVESDAYFDRNGQLVATESTGNGSTEIAYDGARRAYQTRLVTDLEATKYASGVYQYRDPLPVPGDPSGGTIPGTGGDDEVLAVSHALMDGVGNVLEAIALEATHGDSGLSLSSSPKDYVQSAMHYYYDEVHRPTASVNLGTSTDTYTYAALTARVGTAPGSSDTKLVSTFTYDNASRLLSSTDAAGTESRRSYDDLGRVVYAVSNYDNFNFSSGANTGPDDKDLATLRVYNALNQVTELTALDPNGDGTGTDNQTTTYTYGDAVLAHVLAEIEMPDSTGASDVISFDYYMDGRPDTRTDQRGVIVRYDYDRILRTLARNVTSLGASGDVDGAVRAISYTYDNMSRIDRVTSHSAVVDVSGTYHTSNVVNQVGYAFHDHHGLATEQQEHDGTIDGSTLEIGYEYDESLTTGVYDHALRRSYTVYPDGRQVHTTYGTGGGVDDLLSRASGLANEHGSTANTPGDPIVTYTWMGGGTMAKKRLEIPGIDLDRITPEADGTAPSQGLDGLDRFGRVKDHAWINLQGTRGSTTDDTETIHIAHGYDRVHRMLYADRQVYSAFSHAYAHDDLHRLTSWSVGLLNRDGGGDVDLTAPGDNASTSDLWTLAAEDHDLDLLHNAVAIEDDATSDKVTQSVNDANEIEGASDIDRVTDPRVGNEENRIDFNVSGDKDYLEAGPGITNFATQVLVDDSNSNALKITTGSPATPAMVFVSPELGAMPMSMDVRTPSGYSGTDEVGIFFGYQSEDLYYLFVKEYDNGDARYYRVTEGKKELLFTDTGFFGTTANTWYDVIFRGISNAGDIYDSVTDFTSVGGFPSGRWGVYTEIADAEFDYIRLNPATFSASLSAAWESWSPMDMIDKGSGDGALYTSGNYSRQTSPVLLRGVRSDRFEVTFSMTRQVSHPYTRISFVFNHTGEGEMDLIYLWHDPSSPSAPVGAQVDSGTPVTTVSATQTPANVHAPTGSPDEDDEVWYRIVSDGTDVTVYSADTEANLATASACFQTSGGTDRFDFSQGGGRIGFLTGSYGSYIDNLTVKTDRDNNGSFETTEHVDTFDLNGSDLVEEDLEYDAAGNLTYDGVFLYTYDAFNRPVAAAKAYRDGSGDLQTGTTVVTYAYDGQHRRVSRTKVDDRPTDFYHAGGRTVHERWEFGDTEASKQHVWGLTYIDELIETRVLDTFNAQTEATTYNSYYAITDTRYCILGLVDTDGDWVERYEYTPYGQRQVFFSSGTNDAKTLTPTTGPAIHSFEAQVGIWVTYQTDDAICAFGFQGLRHDEETGNIYQRAREYSVRLGRFMQRDPLGYPDGMNGYAAYHVLYGGVDPWGLDWHHNAAKSVFDPANASSTINQLPGMTLEDGIDIHSAEFGWELDATEHTRRGGVHSIHNSVGMKWETHQELWLRRQYAAGHRVITKEMLDCHIRETQILYGIRSRSGAVLRGSRATERWAGHASYIRKLRTGGLFVGEIAGRRFLRMIPIVGGAITATSLANQGASASEIIAGGTMDAISPLPVGVDELSAGTTCIGQGLVEGMSRYTQSVRERHREELAQRIGVSIEDLDMISTNPTTVTEKVIIDDAFISMHMDMLYGENNWSQEDVYVEMMYMTWGCPGGSRR